MLTLAEHLLLLLYITLLLVLELRNPIGADSHGMKSDLHLVGVFVIHMGAQLVIGDKMVRMMLYMDGEYHHTQFSLFA